MGCPVKIAKFKARVAKTKAEIKLERHRRAQSARDKEAIARLRAKVEYRREPRLLEMPFWGRTVFAAPPPPAATGEGVYLLRETGTNFVKIGWTGDFRVRYRSMRSTTNPRKLVFLGWLSRQQREGEFHCQFAPWSVGGDAGGIEWFEMPEEKIAELVAMCVEVPK